MRDSRRLLLISHCVPSPVNGADRARAWQLLKLLSHDYRVNLACLYDGPINLAQWSEVRARTERFTVETTQNIRRAASRCLWHIHPKTSTRLEFGQPIGRTVRNWLADEPVETVVCTHPSVWASLHGVYAHRKLLDMRSYTPLSNQRPGQPGALTDSCAISEADILIQSESGTPGQTLGLAQNRILLPDAVDVEQITTVHDTDTQGDHTGRKQQVVYHTDWNQPQAREHYNRFVRLIWPEVSRMVPYAEITPSYPNTTQHGLKQLADASLVINTETEPRRACMPILQAMTLKRAVVASEQAVSVLGAKQGEHLMRARGEIDWVMQCVTALSNARLRLQISENARRFVERYRQVKLTNCPLLQALGSTHESLPRTLARAA